MLRLQCVLIVIAQVQSQDLSFGDYTRLRSATPPGPECKLSNDISYDKDCGLLDRSFDNLADECTTVCRSENEFAWTFTLGSVAYGLEPDFYQQQCFEEAVEDICKYDYFTGILFAVEEAIEVIDPDTGMDTNQFEVIRNRRDRLSRMQDEVVQDLATTVERLSENAANDLTRYYADLADAKQASLAQLEANIQEVGLFESYELLGELLENAKDALDTGFAKVQEQFESCNEIAIQPVGLQDSRCHVNCYNRGSNGRVIEAAGCCCYTNGLFTVGQQEPPRPITAGPTLTPTVEENSTQSPTGTGTPTLSPATKVTASAHFNVDRSFVNEGGLDFFARYRAYNGVKCPEVIRGQTTQSPPGGSSGGEVLGLGVGEFIGVVIGIGVAALGIFAYARTSGGEDSDYKLFA